MCLIFTCGTHEFSSQLRGYENVTGQCQNCGNWSAHVVKRWPWFTFCFIPILPLSTHAYKDVVCHVCNRSQKLKDRPDIMSQAGGGGGGGGHYK